MALFRHIFRRLIRTPEFTGIALLTLAIGIGANTAIFSVINGVLIKPLPYPQSENLVGVWHGAPGIPSMRGDVNCSPTMYFTYREESHTFEQFGLWSNGSASVTGVEEPEQVQALFVTYGTLQALGVQPKVGHWFSEADDTPGSLDTVMLTYGYWQRRFGGNAALIGRQITIDSKPRTVIGVMPREFRFLDWNAELLLPERLDRNKIFLGDFSYQGIARLKPGVTLQQANTDIARVLGIWINAWPTPPGFARELFQNARIEPRLKPLKQEVVGDVGTVLWVVMGTIGLVLLMACANVANLLLVRMEGRRQELAVRASIGATWKRIAGEMLAESLTLGMLAGVLGIGLAYGGLRLLVRMAPATLPRVVEIGIDPVVLAFTFAVSLFAGLLFGVIPVAKYAAPHLAMGLRGGRTMSQGREQHRARNVLVVLQVSAALVLLIGAGLMIRTFQALRSVDPGFARPSEVQLLRLSIPDGQVREPERVIRMQNDILDKLAAIAGVTSAAFGNSAPLDRSGPNDLLYADDKTYTVGQIPPIRRFRFVSPGYLATSGTPLIVGRDINWADIYDKRRVAIVSENLAREMWGDPRMALGRRIREGMKDPWREIVGVAGDVYDDGVQQKATAIVYWPAMLDSFYGESPFVRRGVAFLIRTPRAGTESFLADARKAIWSVNPNLPVFLVRTLKDVQDRSMARTSFTLVMLAIASSMALLLGIVGIYGVISYAVSQRTREVGIRMALGAEPAELTRMFIGQGLVLTGAGIMIGLAASAAVTRLMTSLLFKTNPIDPPTYAAVAASLVFVAFLACYLPAQRVTSVNPVEALRTE
jgi:predicted permease